MIKSDAGMQLKLTLQLLPLVRLNSGLQVSLCKQLCLKKRNHVVLCAKSLSTLKYVHVCLLLTVSIIAQSTVKMNDAIPIVVDEILFCPK